MSGTRNKLSYGNNFNNSKFLDLVSDLNYLPSYKSHLCFNNKSHKVTMLICNIICKSYNSYSVQVTCQPKHRICNQDAGAEMQLSLGCCRYKATQGFAVVKTKILIYTKMPFLHLLFFHLTHILVNVPDWGIKRLMLQKYIEKRNILDKSFWYRIHLGEADQVWSSPSKGPDSDRGLPFE